jgi:hypothetical protein
MSGNGSDFNFTVKCDTAANWATANPVLLKGQQGYEVDTGKSKYGDNSSSWSLLPYAESISPKEVFNTAFAGLPAANSVSKGTTLFITDKSNNGSDGLPAYSDGTNWRYYYDNSIVT